jgi:hypothetical protein
VPIVTGAVATGFTGVAGSGVGIEGLGAIVFTVVDSTPVAYLIKSRGSTLYFSIRSSFRPASTHSKNEYPACAASVSVYGQYG